MSLQTPRLVLTLENLSASICESATSSWGISKKFQVVQVRPTVKLDCQQKVAGSLEGRHVCTIKNCQFSDCKDPLIVGHAFLAWHWQDILPCTMRSWLHCMIMIQHRLCLFDSSRWPELSEKKQGPNLAKSSIIILVQYRPMEVASPGAITNFR